MEIGEEKGKEIGKEIGVKLGEKRGKIKGRILGAIELRFDKVSPSDNEIIDQITDLTVLDRLFDVAKHAKSIAEFRKALKQTAASKG